jgi:hypothetical protein
MNYSGFSKNKILILTVKPDFQMDVYKLYDQYDKYVGVADIPDYKTSILMNTLFRNIKENTNLDLLEESDDDEEFENTDFTKFVHMERALKMKCIYNDKFHKWRPLHTVCAN